MFLFVFQNKTHRGYHTACQQADNRGQFDRRLLNKSLKDYTIAGFGQHALHQMVKDNFAANDILRGHLLIVKTRQQAMWVKLNHDVLAKGDLKLIETYDNLTPEFVNSAFTDYRKLKALQSAASLRLNSSKMNLRRIQEASTGVTSSDLYDGAFKMNMNNLYATAKSIHHECADAYDAITKETMRAHLAAIKLVQTKQLGSAPAAK